MTSGGDDSVRLIELAGNERIDDIRVLFLEYARSLDFELCFQDFDQELESLPGVYAPPAGRIILAERATDGSTLAGCVAVRPLGDGICEMKRLYVRPAFRGRRIGRLLAEAIVRVAKQIGYGRMRLDTVPAMTAAITLYQSLGFRDTSAYCHNPICGARYMELNLADPDPRLP